MSGHRKRLRGTNSMGMPNSKERWSSSNIEKSGLEMTQLKYKCGWIYENPIIIMINGGSNKLTYTCFSN